MKVQPGLEAPGGSEMIAVAHRGICEKAFVNAVWQHGGVSLSLRTDRFQQLGAGWGQRKPFSTTVEDHAIFQMPDFRNSGGLVIRSVPRVVPPPGLQNAGLCWKQAELKLQAGRHAGPPEELSWSLSLDVAWDEVPEGQLDTQLEFSFVLNSSGHLSFPLASRLHATLLIGDVTSALHMLQDRALDVAVRDVDGRSCLHLAAACGYHEVFWTILRHPNFLRSSADALDSNGCTAWDLLPPGSPGSSEW